MAEDEACRYVIEGRVVGDAERIWLSRLVTTRRIVIVPIANALGYDRKSQTEDGIDPNREFPYNFIDQTLCIQTISGRNINKIFRDNVFHISFTFQGGTKVIV